MMKSKAASAIRTGQYLGRFWTGSLRVVLVGLSIGVGDFMCAS